jgi:small-conductance mechanosensitive channel
LPLHTLLVHPGTMDTRKENTSNQRWKRPKSSVTAPKKKSRLQKRRRRKTGKSSVVRGAETRLKGFRQASILAVAMTGFILLLFSADETFSAAGNTETIIQDTTVIVEQENSLNGDMTTGQAADEAIGSLQDMWNNFIINYPKFIIAVGILILAWFLVKLIKLILKTLFKKMKSREGIVTLTAILLWLVAVGIAFSVLVGDVRALVGSFGLIGLALSWALQTPIESFTGWLMNAFRRYYQVGDRILVGEVFGDVYRIDFLSTTVWEIGSPYQAGFVSAEQPTGRLVTFPNNEILTGTVINLTGDFPYVWDELDVAVANESDIPLAMKALEKVATDALGDYMKIPAQNYSAILKRAGYSEEVPEKPQVFLAASDSWTDVIIRYLVGARERRKWKTILLLKVNEEINKPVHKGKIIPVYMRQQIQVIDSHGLPAEITRVKPGDEKSESNQK